MENKFACTSFMPYKLYSNSRKTGRKTLLFVTIPATLIASLLAQFPESSALSILILPVILAAVVSFFIGIAIILSSQKSAVNEELYNRYIDNYYCEFKDNNIIISRSNCLPVWLKKYYPPVEKENYVNLDGVYTARYNIAADSIKSIKMEKAYIGEAISGSGALRNYLFIIETSFTGGKTFIISDHLEDGVKEYIISNYYDLIENPQHEGWHRKSVEKMFLQPVIKARIS